MKNLTPVSDLQIQILLVYNRGDQAEEYVSLRALEDCNLSDYIIADNTFTEKGQLSNKAPHVYWFPDKQVKKDDLIVLRTRAGKEETVKKGKQTRHRLYWGLNKPVWNDDGDKAVLIRVAAWSAVVVKSAPPKT